MITFGDSITSGVGASPSTSSWVGLFSPSNQAVSGAQAADLSNKVLTITPAETNLVMIGTNDVRIYRDNATKKDYFEKFLRHSVAWLALPSKLIARNMVTTGTWNNTAANSIGRYTTVNGAKLSGVVTGCKLYVGYIIQNASVAVSTADVVVDGVTVGSISCDGYTVSMNTQNGATYGHACAVFDVSYGTHNVEIVNTSPNGKYLYVNYIANEQLENCIKISNIIKMNTANYTSNGVTLSTTDAYNLIIDNVIADFNCALIDNYSEIDPAIHLGDGVHPNNAGHLIIHNNFKD